MLLRVPFVRALMAACSVAGLVLAICFFAAWSRPTTALADNPLKFLPPETIGLLGGSYRQPLISGTTIYVAQGGELVIFDASALADPVLAGRIPLGGVIERMHLQGTRLFILSETGMSILSVADLHHPQLIQTIALPGIGLDFDLARNHAFIAAGAAGVWSIDVGGVQAQFVGTIAITDTVTQIVAEESRLYLGLSTGVLVGEVDEQGTLTTGNLINHPYARFAVHNNLIALANYDVLRLVDASSSISFTERVSVPINLRGDNILFKGNLVYVPVLVPVAPHVVFRGIRVYDVSDPSAPRQTDSLATVETNSEINLGEERLAVTSERTGSLFVYDAPAVISQAQLLGSVDAPIGVVNEVLPVGTDYFLLEHSQSFDVLHVSTTVNPNVVSSYQPIWAASHPIMHSWVAGDIAVVQSEYASSLQSLYAYDLVSLKDPLHPMLIERSTDNPNGFRDMTLKDDLLYTAKSGNPANSDDGLTIFDQNGSRRGAVSIAQACRLVVSGNLVAVASPQRVSLVDISLPTQPIIVGSYDLPSASQFCAQLAVSGTNLFVLHDQTTLIVLNIGNPASPKFQGSLALNNTQAVLSMRLSGIRLLIHRETTDLLVDVSNSLQMHTIPVPDGYVALINGAKVWIAQANPAATRQLAIVDTTNTVAPIIEATTELPGRDIDNWQLAVNAGEWLVVPAARFGVHVLHATLPQPALFQNAPLTLNTPNASVQLGGNAFTSTAKITLTSRFAAHLPKGDEGRMAVGNAVLLESTDNATGEGVTPGNPYTVIFTYDDTMLGSVLSDTLAIYVLQNGQWVRAPTSALNMTTHTVQASLSHVGLIAVQGDTRRNFVPLVRR